MAKIHPDYYHSFFNYCFIMDSTFNYYPKQILAYINLNFKVNTLWNYHYIILIKIIMDIIMVEIDIIIMASDNFFVDNMDSTIKSNMDYHLLLVHKYHLFFYHNCDCNLNVITYFFAYVYYSFNFFADHIAFYHNLLIINLRDILLMVN